MAGGQIMFKAKVCLSGAMRLSAVIGTAIIITACEPADQNGQDDTSATSNTYLLVAESSMVKVMPDIPLGAGPHRDIVEIAVAGGEIEAGQIIIVPVAHPLRNVEFEVSALKGPGGAVLPDSAVSIAVMGYVQTRPQEKLVYPVERVGWFPDPILPFVKRFDVDEGKNQSLWLSISAPTGQPAGLYRGRVTVFAANAETQTIPVEVRVFSFDIPQERSLPTWISTFDGQLSRIHGDAWGPVMYSRYADFFHAHRINFDNFYREGEAPPTLEDVERLVAGGQDAWALRYIRQPGKGGSGPGADPATYDDYLAKAIAEARAAYEMFDRAGAADITYVYFFDEVTEEHLGALRNAATEVHKAMPNVPIFTTAFDWDKGIPTEVSDVIDIWAVPLHGYDRDKIMPSIKEARANGDKVGWYTANWPHTPYPNLFVEYEAIEARLLMGAMVRKFKPYGYGTWATNAWWQNEKPITKGPYTDWDPFNGGTHGDGSIILPGQDGPLTTIRFENFRDGLEDYEYYQLLEKAVSGARARGVPKKQLKNAEALLIVPEEIVNSLVDFTRDARLLERHRLSIAEAIESLTP